MRLILPLLLFSIFPFFITSPQNMDQDFLPILKKIVPIETLEKELNQEQNTAKKERIIFKHIINLYTKIAQRDKRYPKLMFKNHEFILTDSQGQESHLFVHLVMNEQGGVDSVIIGNKKLARKDFFHFSRWPSLLNPIDYVVLQADGRFKDKQFYLPPLELNQEEKVSSPFTFKEPSFLRYLRENDENLYFAKALPLLVLVFFILFTLIMLFLLSPAFIIGFATILSVTVLSLLASLLYLIFVVAPSSPYLQSLYPFNT